MSKKPPTPSIHARVLGDASISTGVTTIEPMSEIIFAAALYVVLQRKEPISRRTIQALLWPDVSDRVAAHRLRQTLLKLRQIGMPIEVSGKGHIGLNGTPVTVDYEEFLATKKFVETGNNDALVMLPAYEPRFSEAYLEWLDAQKAEVNASMTRVMLGIIARHRVKGEWVEVERNATRLLRFQPYNEEATLALAEAYAMRGGKLQAMEILDRYLNEVGNGPTDLRLPATVMRRRIADRMHPRVETISGQSPLVGRGNEMEQLAGLLEKARTSKGQACFVWGEPGIGKTRLLAEFTTFASLQGIPTQRVQCHPSDRQQPLSVFLDLVPELRSMRGAIGCSPDTFAYLDKLTKRESSSLNPKAHEGEIEFVYAGVRQSLFDLLDAVCDEGTLIVAVEDVHWLDPTSELVFRDMVAWARDHSVFFVFTGRDAPPDWLNDLSRSYREIQLSALGPDSSEEVLFGIVRLHGREIDEDHAEWCVKVAEGNPYFLEELANHWIETTERNSVPHSLAAVLNDRLTRLTPASLQVLQTCAMLESNSTLTRIEQILDYQNHEMLPAINELGRAGMLVLEQSDSRSRDPVKFLTRHDMLSNAALARLTGPAVIFLHQRVASVLEAEIDADDRSAALLWECAKHWQLSGDTARAFKLAQSCAAQLLDIGLPSAAAEAYEKALAYCRTIDEKLEVLEALAHAHFRSRMWKEVSRVVATRRKLLLKVRKTNIQHDDFELMDLHAGWDRVGPRAALAAALECLRANDATPNHRVESGGNALMLGDCICDHDTMRSIYSEVSSIWSSMHVTDALRLRAEMVYHCVCGDLDRGLSSARSILEDKRANGNIGEIFSALLNAGSAFRTAGLFFEAEQSIREAQSIAERHGLAVCSSTAIENLAHLFLELGETEKVRACYSMLSQQYSRREGENSAHRVQSVAVRLALLDSRYGDAVRLTSESLEQVCRDEFVERRAYKLALMVAARLKSPGKNFSKMVSALEATHMQARVNAREGFASYALYFGLVRVGKRARAEELLKAYLGTYRREPWLPKYCYLDFP